MQPFLQRNMFTLSVNNDSANVVDKYGDDFQISQSD